MEAAANNPRKHDKRQIKKLQRSIAAFGFIVPVLIDAEDTIIAGHACVTAALAEGLASVPTVQIEHLSPDQRTAFVIADNRLAELSTWDDQILAEVLQSLSVADLDFSIELTGFDMGEIDLRIESLTSAEKLDKIEAIPAVQQIAVTRPGDLWLLGNHRVLCADALESTSYLALMNGELAAAVFTDPPYNVPVDGHTGGLGKIRHREFAMAAGEMSPEEFLAFLTAVFRLLARNSIDGSLHYACMDWRHIPEIIAAGAVAYDEIKNLCVWAKTNAGMGSLYRSQHELVFVFKHGTAPHRNNVELGKNGRNRTNVWSYASPASFGRTGEEGNLLALHPTVKPVALVADAILDCTARGEIVLDAFLGSGTTLMAAERTGRCCFGLELDPLYVDTIIRRWQTYTGGAATLATTGQTFVEVTADREVDHG